MRVGKDSRSRDCRIRQGGKWGVQGGLLLGRKKKRMGKRTKPVRKVNKIEVGRNHVRRSIMGKVETKEERKREHLNRRRRGK